MIRLGDKSMRVTNQKEFIEKANELHSNKYDYSLVDYQKTNIKVKIICPIHGIFEQTPNKHLAGQGCNKCGRNNTKIGLDKFVDRARNIHGDKYDYSKVNYEHSKKKVQIICRIHGSFFQTPHAHIICGQNCPKCASLMGGSKRTGENNVAHLDYVKEKKMVTCQERYGANTWAESEEGRHRLHDIVTSDDVSMKMISTCQERYGANTWAESDEGRKILSQIMSSDEMKQKVIDGYQSHYGVDHYMKTEEGREKARLNLSSYERREKIRESMFEKYGSYSFFESDNFKSNIMLFQRKAHETKRKNGTFNTSKPEKTLWLLLKDIFGENDVISQYKSDVYPFDCDFYIKSLDLYIELNASWTHGGHWFDETNPFDMEQLNEWKEKSKMKGSRYYCNAINVWTKRDLMKLHTAIDNNLNYLVFWKNDLSDARDWLQSQGLL